MINAPKEAVLVVMVFVVTFFAAMFAVVPDQPEQRDYTIVIELDRTQERLILTETAGSPGAALGYIFSHDERFIIMSRQPLELLPVSEIRSITVLEPKL